MLDKFKFSLSYKADGMEYISDKAENEHYAIDYTYDKGVLKLALIPKVKIELKKSSLAYDYDYPAGSKVFVNGYQSWTTSREFRKHEIQKGLMGLGAYYPVKKFAFPSGDYLFAEYSKKSGFFHSFSYGYIKDGDSLTLVGSLSERQGYTIIYYDMNKNLLRIDKDIEGVTIEKGYALYELYETEGSYNQVFDKYFSAMKIKKPKMQFMCGYTSWYNYYGAISEKICVRDLDSLSALGDKADIFQIDDGYQSKVGDWLTLDEQKFPNGMKYLADRIHSNGYKAGLWMAPFNAARSSRTVAEHPEWLITHNGKKVIGCIAWGGAYTLDFYNKEAADYIRGFFKTVLREWGYDLVKLDFLYSICMYPRHNKSRGQIMCEAIDFLRECVGEDKYILGCGVPLAPAFGKVDFCRISCDVDVHFKERLYNKQTNQEIISTRNAMNNSIFRRHLDGRAFVNDPDVFFLRNSDLMGKDELAVKKGKLVFTDEQKKLLARINNMFANVLFVSDDIGGYGEEQLKLLKEAFTPTKYIVLDAEYAENNPDEVSIKYMDGTDMYKLEFNISSGKSNTVKL
ncbi:MAG: alpha-galactosidase [Clostridia bacterium]|nr:alpha-galactosidase [Clostridia bacterium]